MSDDQPTIPANYRPVREAAAITNTNSDTIYQWIRRDKLIPITHNGRLHVDVTAIQACRELTRRKSNLHELIPPDTLAQLRRDGLSFVAIARRYGVRPARVANYARHVLPPELLDNPTPRNSPDTIPPDTLAQLREDGISFREIAKRYNVSRHSLDIYAQQVLPPELLHRQYDSERNRRIRAGIRPCSRCTLFPEPTNPILDDNHCLYCHVEAAGLDLLWFHESGMAHTVLQHIQGTPK